MQRWLEHLLLVYKALRDVVRAYRMVFWCSPQLLESLLSVELGAEWLDHIAKKSSLVSHRWFWDVKLDELKTRVPEKGILGLLMPDALDLVRETYFNDNTSLTEYDYGFRSRNPYGDSQDDSPSPEELDVAWTLLILHRRRRHPNVINLFDRPRR